METEHSLSCSQNYSIGLCTETDKSSSLLSNFFKNYFKILNPSMSTSSKRAFSFRFLKKKYSYVNFSSF